MLSFLLKVRYLSLLLYIFEWLIFIGLVYLIYKIFGRSFETEDKCIFTAVWGLCNAFVNLND